MTYVGHSRPSSQGVHTDPLNDLSVFSESHNLFTNLQAFPNASAVSDIVTLELPVLSITFPDVNIF